MSKRSAPRFTSQLVPTPAEAAFGRGSVRSSCFTSGSAFRRRAEKVPEGPNPPDQELRRLRAETRLRPRRVEPPLETNIH